MVSSDTKVGYESYESDVRVRSKLCNAAFKKRCFPVHLELDHAEKQCRCSVVTRSTALVWRRRVPGTPAQDLFNSSTGLPHHMHLSDKQIHLSADTTHLDAPTGTGAQVQVQVTV